MLSAQFLSGGPFAIGWGKGREGLGGDHSQETSSHTWCGDTGLGCLQQDIPRITRVNLLALGGWQGFWVCWGCMNKCQVWTGGGCRDRGQTGTW